LTHGTPLPLTQLSEEESLFFSTVRQFAEETIAPQVSAMDDQQQFAAGLVQRLFELGLMGIEIPEELGGAGGSFFDAVLAVEAVSYTHLDVYKRQAISSMTGTARWFIFFWSLL